jgi:hypothetical protein
MNPVKGEIVRDAGGLAEVSRKFDKMAMALPSIFRLTGLQHPKAMLFLVRLD